MGWHCADFIVALAALYLSGYITVGVMCPECSLDEFVEELDLGKLAKQWIIGGWMENIYRML